MNTAPNNTGSSSSGGFGGGAGGSGGGPCGACKFLRRKCQFDCLFAPYFNSDQGAAHFAAVHKVFGASNFSKLLQNLPLHKRLDAVVTICYEAQARLHDPIYGCVAHIFALQQQVVNLQTEISYMQARLATLELPAPAPPLSQPPLMIQRSSPVVSVPDLPSASGMPAASSFDLSMFFDPEVRMEFREYGGGGGGGGRNPSDNSNLSATTGGSSGGGDDDFQALARELLLGQGSSLGSPPSTEPSPELTTPVLQPPPPPPPP